MDREAGANGRCRADHRARIFHQGIEWAGETALTPTYVVSFSGCNLSCPFCLTGGPSQDATAGKPADADALDAIANDVARRSAVLSSVTILGGEPSIHLHAALELIARIPRGLPIVWKTNAYAAEQAWTLLAGQVDWVLADYKFGTDACARRLGGVPRYLEALHRNLLWARGSAQLIIRHLLMPGHLRCCLEPMVDWLSAHIPEAPVSLMTGFLPAHRSASAGLGRANQPHEIAEAERLLARSRLALAPWSRHAPIHEDVAGQDELFIDPEGRILIDSASPALLAALDRMRGEVAFGS